MTVGADPLGVLGEEVALDRDISGGLALVAAFDILILFILDLC